MNSVSFLSCIDIMRTYFQYRLFWSKLMFCACICFLAIPALGQTVEGNEAPQQTTQKVLRKKKTKGKRKKEAKKSKSESSRDIDDAFWVSKSKQFAKDPMSLKSETDAYRMEIEEIKENNKALEAQERLNYIGLDSLKHAVNKMKQELSAIEDENDELRQVLKTFKAVQRAGVKQGLIYRIVLHEASIEEEDSAFGEFRKEDEAQKFLANLRKWGFKGEVNILPYIDGRRVSEKDVESYVKS